MPDSPTNVPTDEIADYRQARRFVITPPIDASFVAADIKILDASACGLQVQHDDPLRLGFQGRISFAITQHDRVAWKGTVVWSHMAKTPDSRGKHPYVSGIRIDENPTMVETALRQLVDRGSAYPERDSIEKKRKALRDKARQRASRNSVKTITTRTADLTTDQLLMINHARERLQSHPDEAKKWYARARYALSEDTTSKVGAPMHYREDVLAVWEYLERSVDLDKILRVFEEHRK
jgi:hypothetical protein